MRPRSVRVLMDVNGKNNVLLWLLQSIYPEERYYVECRDPYERYLSTRKATRLIPYPDTDTFAEY